MQIHASFPLQPPVSQPGRPWIYCEAHSTAVRGGGGEAGTFWGWCLEKGFRHIDSERQAHGPLLHRFRLPQMDLCGHQNTNIQTDTCRDASVHSKGRDPEVKVHEPRLISWHVKKSMGAHWDTLYRRKHCHAWAHEHRFFWGPMASWTQTCALTFRDMGMPRYTYECR